VFLFLWGEACSFGEKPASRILRTRATQDARDAESGEIGWVFSPLVPPTRAVATNCWCGTGAQTVSGLNMEGWQLRGWPTAGRGGYDRGGVAATPFAGQVFRIQSLLPI